MVLTRPAPETSGTEPARGLQNTPPPMHGISARVVDLLDNACAVAPSSGVVKYIRSVARCSELLARPG